jgi:hypothetical protein
MRRIIPTLLVVTAALAALSACTHDVDDAHGRVLIEDNEEGQAEVFAVPSDVDAERVYVGGANFFEVTAESPWHYGVFDLLAKAKVGIEVSNADGSDAWVGFKVYAVNADGSMRLLGVLEGQGWAGAVLRTQKGGSFVVESVGEVLPTSLRLDLTCMNRNGARCSPLAQPGEFCGSRGGMTCDQGLFCQIESGCGRDDRGGTCELPAEICPAVVGPTVCGCDGKQYAGECEAHAGGVNVDYVGECPCDPLVFNTKVDGFVDVTGGWIGKASTDSWDVSSHLLLNADGTFTYEQVLDPACRRTPPFCGMASRVLTMTGTWENQGFAVQLTPSTQPAPEEMAQSFLIQQSCDGTVQLATTELGQDRVLGFDKCSTTTCGDNEHCELVEVQCIRAPCYPVATCVAN